MGDSSTVGVGDRYQGHWRGWTGHFHECLTAVHDVSFCNLAIAGATASDVRHRQLSSALDHAPHLVSLMVGVNDTMRSCWNDDRVRQDLLFIADSVHQSGATLMTARFHDVARQIGLPPPLAKPQRRRLAIVNETYAEIARRYGGVHVDLPAVIPYRKDLFSVDRLHPSELGHRWLARAFVEALNSQLGGLDRGQFKGGGRQIPLPSLECDGVAPGRFDEAQWLVTEVVPWLGRRARDLGPWAAHQVVARGQQAKALGRGELSSETPADAGPSAVLQ